MLKYNGSNPSLLKISVELDRQNLKQFCVIFTFLQTVLVSFEAESDSNYHILHNGKADLLQWNPQCKMIKKMNGNQSLFQYLGVCYAEGMKMCSFIGYKCKSCIIIQFSGFKLVNEKYHRPNL